MQTPDPTTPRTLRVAAIGIADYRNEAFQPRFATMDAAAVSEKPGADHARDHDAAMLMAPLVDAAATKSGILKVLRHMAETSDGNDGVILYCAEHGQTCDGGSAFLPHDISNLAAMYSEGLTSDKLMSAVARIPAARLMLLIDIGFADAPDRGRAAELAHDMQVYFLMATSETEKAQDLAPSAVNGLFADTLLWGGSAAPRPRHGVTSMRSVSGAR